MSMRIDGHRPPVDTDAARRLEQASQAERANGLRSRPETGDRVEVSADAQLVATAVQAAQDTPSIRPEAVERGRRLLESGTLGQDPVRLADKMIDSLLQT